MRKVLHSFCMNVKVTKYRFLQATPFSYHILYVNIYALTGQKHRHHFNGIYVRRGHERSFPVLLNAYSCENKGTN